MPFPTSMDPDIDKQKIIHKSMLCRRLLGGTFSDLEIRKSCNTDRIKVNFTQFKKKIKSYIYVGRSKFKYTRETIKKVQWPITIYFRKVLVYVNLNALTKPSMEIVLVLVISLKPVVKAKSCGTCSCFKVYRGKEWMLSDSNVEFMWFLWF